VINNKKIRVWATPLAIGAFALSATTGVMIFFHLDFGLVKVAHEWFSWFLVLGGLFHVIGSWQSFVRYFSNPTGKVIITIFVLFLIASFLPLGKSDRGEPSARMSKILLHAPFASVANVAEHRPEELMNKLGSSGIHIERKEETIQEIAVRNNKRGVDILNMIF